MPSAIHVFLCTIAALAFWGIIGFALGRRLLPAPLAVPLAPALGWAFHSALALPLYRFPGFSPLTVAAGSAVFLAAAIWFLRFPPAAEYRDAGAGVPPFAYGLAALLSVVPAIALFPKISGAAVTLAGPIFDHSKVAIVDEMVRLGLPPANPFFGGDGGDAPLVYYYLWHFSAAELAAIFGVSGWEAGHCDIRFHSFFLARADDGLRRLDRRPHGGRLGCAARLCGVSTKRAFRRARRPGTLFDLPAAIGLCRMVVSNDLGAAAHRRRFVRAFVRFPDAAARAPAFCARAGRAFARERCRI